MPLFNHKLSLNALLKEIPEAELARIAQDTKVDYCTKVLSGKVMFYLLLYGMVSVDRLSQRSLSDLFSSPVFRTLFSFEGMKRKVAHSSISSRLSVIDLAFFSGAYESVYARFSSLYTPEQVAGMHLQRVDSTLVRESSNKLKAGLTCGNSYQKRKMLKYTVNFNGMFSSFAVTHTQERYACESLALPENVLGHFKKVKDHATAYVFDRGQCSAEAFKAMQQPHLNFVGRLQETRRLKVVEELPLREDGFEAGALLSDRLVQLYKRKPRVTKDGKESRAAVLVEETFRVIRFRPSANPEAELLLITNMLDKTPHELAQMYRRRWDIEVFFRFLKQELNFSHLLSLNENGIQVVLYMTMIAAMLVMIYKKENEIGYKTAVRRMRIELECLITAIIVVQTGGDIRKSQLPDP